MKDDWLSVALSDDAVVAELLSRLKHHPSSSSKGLHLTLPLSGWGHRQPRSQPSVKKAYTTITRCSPTTPLSWSDDGYDESSRPPSSDLSSTVRSKGTFIYETSNTSSSSRSKKKRTFTQLKEEEKLLLKERVHLKRELASIHVTLKEQRAKSDDLKRIKFDLNLQSSNDIKSVSNRCNLVEPSRTDSVLSGHITDDDDLAISSTKNQNTRFFLPDLNAMPSEDEIGTL